MHTRSAGNPNALLLALWSGVLLMCAATCGGRPSAPKCEFPEIAPSSARVRWLEVQAVAANGVSVATIHIGTQWMDGKLLDRGIWRVSDVDRPLLPPEFSRDASELQFCSLSTHDDRLFIALHPEMADFGIALVLRCREEQWIGEMQRTTDAGDVKIADVSVLWSEAEFLARDE